MIIRRRLSAVTAIAILVTLSARVSAQVSNLSVRAVAANLSSGNFQSYEQAGIDIFKALKPDIVAIQDHDHSTGRGYREGSIVIGLINHGDSYLMGHGPGVMTVLSCPTPHLEPVIDPRANIANYLGVGEWAAGGRKTEFCSADFVRGFLGRNLPDGWLRCSSGPADLGDLFEGRVTLLFSDSPHRVISGGGGRRER